MDSLEVLVTQTQGLSGSMSDLQSLNEQLKEAEPLLATNRGALRDVLARLDPEQHSLTWAHVLVSLVQDPAAAGGPESLLQTLQIFLDMCNPAHIRIVPEKYAALCRSFKDTILSHYGHDGAKRAVLPLMRALRKMQPSPSHLTPQHVDVFQVALLARTYGVVTPLVEEEIYDVLPKVTGVTATDFLLYCLYGGMLLIGLKKFKKALELLHYAVTTPTTEMNAIIVACYKKFVLLSLIVNGQVPQFSKYTSSSVQRSLRMHCQPYMDLASVYAGRDIGELRNAVAAHTKVLAADLNLGIAKQAVASLYRRNIQRITQTYLTLSLQDIASTVQLGSGKEAEQHVLRMHDAAGRARPSGGRPPVCQPCLPQQGGKSGAAEPMDRSGG
eukprot:jgi/Mesvir1/26771/Mv20546-RA.1